MKIGRGTPAGLALAGALAFGGAAQAQTITNGSFEGSPAGNNQAVDVGDSTSIAGWTVINSSGSTTGGGKVVAYLVSGDYGIYTPFGNDFLDLTGYSGSTGNSGVQQTIDTLVGGAYTLSFYLGQFVGSAPVTVMANAGGAATVVTDPNVVGAGTVTNGTQWTLATYDFTATDSRTTLSLYNGTTNTDFIGLDNVSVSGPSAIPPGAVPEPASWAMMIAGFGLTGAALRRRRRATLRFA